MSKKKSDLKSVSVRIPVELLQELHYVADYEGRSVNGQIIYLIRECIHEFKEKNGDFKIEE